jgi:polyisoprenoid-binding protein YceI
MVRSDKMTRWLFGLGCAVLLSAGCENPSSPTGDGPAKPEVSDKAAAYAINPENTTIGFEGTKDDGAHTGKFNKFAGDLYVNPETKALEGVAVEIQSDSLESDAPKLTDHLKNADFFDVNEYPTITFSSTKVEAKAGAEGEYTITGDLTLHGTTKELSFPATVTVADDKVTLKSEFKFDRTEYGMNYAPDKVHKEVSVNVSVDASATAAAE